MAKIFLTGATGYVGGDVLYRLAASNASKLSISTLVRGAAKADQVAKAYPSVCVVQGDLNNTELIENEARNADIVLHLAATGHVESSTAISKGLTSPARSSAKYWIQISGATLLAANEIAEGTFGQKTTKVYDDMKDIDEIHSIITRNPKRVVDNLIVTQDPSKVKAALIIGPHIYGGGRGPLNNRSVQAPEITRATFELNEGFRLNAGKNNWSNVHVHDLSDLIVSLVDAAAEGKPDLWNKDGIYFPENGNMEFGELCERIAAAAHKQGLIPETTIQKIVGPKEADSLSGHASILWGTNAILRSTRARLLLGWQPSSPSLEEEIPDIVRREAESYRKTKI